MLNIVEVYFQKLSQGFIEPHYASEEASGMDIYACIDTDITLKSLERVLIPTGFALCIPKGYEAQIRPRSGLAYKNGITVLNSPGTIDSDYRGEVKVLLANLSTNEFIVKPKTRIAQLIIQSVAQGKIKIVNELPHSERGEGGFGSTGHL